MPDPAHIENHPILRIHRLVHGYKEVGKDMLLSLS